MYEITTREYLGEPEGQWRFWWGIVLPYPVVTAILVLPSALVGV